MEHKPLIPALPSEMDPDIPPAMAAQPLILQGSDRFGHTGTVTPVYYPGDNVTVVGEYHSAQPIHMELIERAAEQGFQRFRKTKPYQRAEILNNLADRLEARCDELALLITREAGKPIKLARNEVERAAKICRAYANEAERIASTRFSIEGYSARLERFPIGPVLAITPFNFPLNLVIHKLAPAIAAGCSITIKPAPQAPLSAIVLARLAVESGYEAISVVPATNEMAEMLVKSSVFRKISFTGSAKVGWHLRGQAVGKSLTLELGGNAAVIVDDLTQPVADITKRVAFGAFAYSGQICISVQRIFVNESIREAFVQALVAATRALKVGDPFKPETDVGPMITMIDVQRSRGIIKEALRQGANVVYGGNTYNAFTMNPTLIDRTTPDMAVNTEEVFAPIATIASYKTFDEGLMLANCSRYGIHAGVYTSDPAKIEQAYDRLEVAGVLINEIPTYRADSLPYGGVKESGLGREGVLSGIDEYTYPKTLLIRD
jgi:acyl-CoA reductase-like NAD-dependent aldehyde dehydrogenase